MAIPKKDSLLVPYSENFSTRISATPALYGVLPATAASYALLHAAYSDAYSAMIAARLAGNRSKSLVSTKDSTRVAAVKALRGIYGAIQANPDISDADKDLVGVTIRGLPTTIPVPNAQPGLDIKSVIGHSVRGRLHDAADASRAKPPGVTAAAICTYVGPTAPTDPSLYSWQGSTGKSDFTIELPDTLAPGTKVHITALWLNEKQQTGPACDPISVTIGYGMSMAA